MQIKNLALLFVYCFLFISVKAQEIQKSGINIVKLSCQDSLGFLTNMGSTSRACEFFFLKNEKVSDFFYHENLSYQDFYDFAFNKDISKIKIVKLVTEKYVPSVHDFVYCYNQDNESCFTTSLKIQQKKDY